MKTETLAEVVLDLRTEAILFVIAVEGLVIVGAKSCVEREGRVLGRLCYEDVCIRSLETKLLSLNLWFYGYCLLIDDLGVNINKTTVIIW